MGLSVVVGGQNRWELDVEWRVSVKVKNDKVDENWVWRGKLEQKLKMKK